MVLEGDDDVILSEAAGHVPSTALPGGAGNVAIAGHRDTFFRALRNIRQEDVITLSTAGGTYQYRVESLDEVKPKDVQVLDASINPTLTLITCYPFNYIGAAPLRFVVKAAEIGSSEGNAPEGLLSHRGGAVPLVAGTFPAADVDSPARARMAAGHDSTTQLISYRPSAESHAIPLAAVPSANSPRGTSKNFAAGEIAENKAQPAVEIPLAKHSDRARKNAEDAQDDPWPEPAAHSHKKFRKVRAWLTYIPHHLK